MYLAPLKALAAEVASKFGKTLGPLGVTVRELTGDTSLSRAAINETQILVATPEKWDVITRKTADVGLATQVRLLIIDEVHLLHEDRGAVLEALVARTLRMALTTQNVIRVVALSATLPNYKDVAAFLQVNPERGLFFFDAGEAPAGHPTLFAAFPPSLFAAFPCVSLPSFLAVHHCPHEERTCPVAMPPTNQRSGRSR
eukprot:SAG22_NODE_174_length_16466_cov_34.991568_13_plen_199_part_00